MEGLRFVILVNTEKRKQDFPVTSKYSTGIINPEIHHFST